MTAKGTLRHKFANFASLAEKIVSRLGVISQPIRMGIAP